MELQFFGANCLRIITKQATLVVDDDLKGLGGRSVLRSTDVALFTVHQDGRSLGTKEAPGARLLIADPGEYEVAGVSIFGVPARAHMDEAGTHNATIFKIQFDDIRLVVLGHIYPNLDNDQLEELGMVDVLVAPVGGSGYTLDAVGALQMIKKIEPKVFIPTHYADSALNFPVPQRELTDALKEMSMEASQTVAKYKVKPAEFGETTQVIVLEKS